MSQPPPTEFDVIVVGGGGSGLAAAVSAAEEGLKVLLLEKEPQLGGTTGIAIGSFTAGSTRIQKQQAIEDSPTDHNEDAGKFAPPDLEARGNYELRGYFLNHASETLRWLESLGLNFHGPSPEPPNRVPRMHNVVPNAKAYIATLQRKLVGLGGTIFVEAQVNSLLRENGRVVGVEARHNGIAKHFSATRGVVLAAGDYANNPQMISEHKGPAFSAIEGINPYATGEGQLLAASAGAKLLNMDVTYGPELRFVPPSKKPFSQLLPSSGPAARVLGWLMPLVPKPLVTAMIKRLLVTWQHPEDALFTDGAVLINQQARRFCDETQCPDREIAVAAQTNKLAYILLDAELAELYSRWPHFISTAPEIAYAYVDDYLRLRPDIAVDATSWRELASKRGLPPELTLQADNLPPLHRKLREERWILLGPVKAYFTTTEGGAAIDHQFQVLDHNDQPIEGLYAVGQTGLGGQILWGHGLHIAWAMTSGRLVGKHLARSPAS